MTLSRKELIELMARGFVDSYFGNCIPVDDEDRAGIAAALSVLDQAGMVIVRKETIKRARDFLNGEKGEFPCDLVKLIDEDTALTDQQI